MKISKALFRDINDRGGKVTSTARGTMSVVFPTSRTADAVQFMSYLTTNYGDQFPVVDIRELNTYVRVLAHTSQEC